MCSHQQTSTTTSPSNDGEFKQCTKCHAVCPIEDFYKQGKQRNHRPHSECKTCLKFRAFNTYRARHGKRVLSRTEYNEYLADKAYDEQMKAAGFKQCNECRHWMEFDKFHVVAVREDGTTYYMGKCKKCRAKVNKARRKAAKETALPEDAPVTGIKQPSIMQDSLKRVLHGKW